MKADLILSGKINKQLIHHEQNEKTLLTILAIGGGGVVFWWAVAIAGAVLLWLLSYKGAPLGEVLRSIARIIVVFFAAHAYKYKEKKKNVSA